MGRELIDDGEAVWVAEGLIGAIYALPGQVRLRAAAALVRLARRRPGRPLQHDGRHHRRASPGSPRRRASTPRRRSAAARCWRAGRTARTTTTRCAGLRWAPPTSRAGRARGRDACAEALTRIASRSGHPDALAALAHAIGEAALAEGDADTAAEQLSRAVELHARWTSRSSARRSSCGRGSPWPRRASASRRSSDSADAYRAPASSAPGRLPPRRRGRWRRSESRSAARLGQPGRGRCPGRGPDPPGARGDAPRRRRPNQPRDRPGALPEPPNRGHARAQHPPQARLQVARGGRAIARGSWAYWCSASGERASGSRRRRGSPPRSSAGPSRALASPSRCSPA